SVTDDATCLIYNPARLNFGLKSNVALMHNSLVQDMSTDFIALKFPVSDKVSMGLGLFTTYISGIEIRNIPGASIGEFDSRNMSLGLSFGYKINPSLSLGLTTKYLFEKIYVDEASGFAFDFGSNYTKKNLSLALVVSNVGSLSALRNQKTVLPTSLRLGGSYKISKDKFSFIIGIDGYKVIDGGSFHVNTGGEAGYKDFVFLRLGYQTEYENKGFTSGLGFKYKSVSFDYAFVPYNNNFGNSNTFSLGLNF
ncbi:MAG: PorV/PorQ family protein, partial [Ignavibacteria bacterium]|nr:PorV/PorQ family protein [Ignavibacteria bacterium]